MSLYRVNYEIMTEARTDSFLGASNTNLNNLWTTVSAQNPGQARDMVEAQNGGWSRCRVINVHNA